MKTLFAILILSVSTTQARSLHPCTPTVPMQPSTIGCNEGSISYTIRINTWRSPISRACEGENRVTSSIAKIEIFQDAEKIDELFAANGTFEYSLGPAFFKSPRLGLDLKECVSPQHGGGFSFGN